MNLISLKCFKAYLRPILKWPWTQVPTVRLPEIPGPAQKIAPRHGDVKEDEEDEEDDWDKPDERVESGELDKCGKQDDRADRADRDEQDGKHMAVRYCYRP